MIRVVEPLRVSVSNNHIDQKFIRAGPGLELPVPISSYHCSLQYTTEKMLQHLWPEQVGHCTSATRQPPALSDPLPVEQGWLKAGAQGLIPVMTI